MTLLAEEVQATVVIPKSPQNNLAPWHIRARAFAIDVLPGSAVVATMGLVAFILPPRGTGWWVCAAIGGLAILLMLVNRMLLPTVIGWSLGRAFFGIAVVARDGAAVGPWMLLLRDLAHLVDTASLVGWLWPLWDSQRRTFADILLGTKVQFVQPVERPHRLRQWTAAILLTAAALCLDGAHLSYGLVYSRDQAIDQTRAQIVTQGPKMVAQMLTYDPKTLRDDFAHAQSLVTDRYRGQLVTQQQVVEKGHPVINEYWVTASSIQSATPDRATMLVFMHGRRGEGQEQRYITATVRVAFVKDGGDHWRIDDLTVVTKPKPPGNGK